MKLITALVCSLFLTCLASNAVAGQKLLHVVSFRFKDTATTGDIQKVEAEFVALKKRIKQVKSLECGTNVSPEKLNKGFTHCWILSFKTEKDRDAYLVHPDHKAFAQSLGPVLEDVFVIDFWNKG